MTHRSLWVVDQQAQTYVHSSVRSFSVLFTHELLSFQGILNEQGFLEGAPPTENARFGMAISAVPDIDLDGYSDVIVGAPLEDKERGVVYVYNGDKKTLSRQFSQVHGEC